MQRFKDMPTGLSPSEVEAMRAKYGSNALPKKRPTPFLKLFLRNLGDPIIKILILALLINFLFLSKTFDIFETLGILFAIVSAASISALSERGGERAFEALWEESAHTAVRVLRGTETVLLPIEELVFGDTVLLSAGEQIPADGILTSGEIKISQAALNGESRDCVRTPPRASVPIHVDELWSPDNEGVLLRGAVVTGGEGQMRIARVGENTLYGHLIGELGLDTRESPLRARLSRLAMQMSRVGGVAAVLVALSYLLHTFYIDAGGTWAGVRILLSDKSFVMGALLHALMLATTTVVMAVPEGLPMMISVVLSQNIKRMQRDRVLVKKPVGIETAGSMDLLFCDKTGTLTEGRPSVVGVMCADGVYYDGIKALCDGAPPALLRALALTAYHNTQCEIPKTRKQTLIGGNATEQALMRFALEARLKRPRVARISGREPFDSDRKYSAVTLDGVRYLKGAPEVLMGACRFALSGDGGRMPMPLGTLEKHLSRLTCDGMRVLAVCAEEHDARTFLAFVCIRDAVRADAPEAVARLREAGVQTVMITGDNRETAVAIARECGILEGKSDALVLSSAELAALSDDEVAKRLSHLSVVARALPSDKSRLVRIAEGMGRTVGMTGDGVNDAPALRLADVGFAMGSGTEVAKAASDIVISDDSLSSIARALLYGRTVFKNIRKFIMFQMTTNLSAVAISVICPMLGIETPITVLQMLWINMIMDTLGSLAFAAEPPSMEFMRERPVPREMPIMNRYMILRIAAMCLWLPLLSVSFLTSEHMREAFGYYEEPTHFLGAFFALFVFADICNSVSARTMHPNPAHRLCKNKTFVCIFAFIVAVQLCIIEFGGAVFRTHPLAMGELALVLFFAALTLPVSAVVKIALKRWEDGK